MSSSICPAKSDFRKGIPSPSGVRIEDLFAVGHADEKGRRLKSRAEPLLEVFEPIDDPVDAELVGVTEQTSPERRGTGSADHREIELGGIRDDPVCETERCFVDHLHQKARLED